MNILEARKNQGQVNHITGDVHYIALGLDPGKTILTIHDAALLDRLTGFSRTIYTLFWFSWPLRRVARVTVVSEATKKYLSTKLGLSEDVFYVIPDCIDPSFTFSEKVFPKSTPRVLQVGVARNKNIERVAEALKSVDCELRIIGRLSEAQRRILKRFGIRYTAVSGLSIEELVAEYRNCDLLVFASTFEGFGMPIVEAQAIGRPVVTSNCSSMPEVAGNGACFVDPYDAISIRKGIIKVFGDEGYRKHLIEEGCKNASKYSSRRIANLYASLYREVLGSSPKTVHQR
ncbi:glycosyltransferase family 1 protein [Rubellicoccus peritrichatus]|uniref:Glycosyltransferase family 1 protein n=1 Tax=Rubellicoccus peritrichatus TaxID=3080537 RepID=A0AAQ3LE24_9BACT|nr:glycosyltransferase family 1 protein [Puniceicoccus sp. CR14]WOO42922.1 glycosyltransferase family 1 protein [Puniceicoccus sp. CR14]